MKIFQLPERAQSENNGAEFQALWLQLRKILISRIHACYTSYDFLLAQTVTSSLTLIIADAATYKQVTVVKTTPWLQGAQRLEIHL
jgi:hypothetical protein